jgi:hypothetical protein
VNVNPVTAYWVKVVAGAVAFLVWLGSVTTIPGSSGYLFTIGAPYQQILFAAAAAAFGWAITQGSTAVTIASRAP